MSSNLIGPKPNSLFPVEGFGFRTPTTRVSSSALPDSQSIPDRFTSGAVRASPELNQSKTLNSELATLLSNPTKQEIAHLWPEIQQILGSLGKNLPKQKLVRAVSILSDARKRRFLRCRIPKYGSMNKGFTEDELLRFMRVLDDARIALLFTYQAVLGLRISEAIKLHIRDVNLKTREIRIGNEKSDRTEYLPIPPQLFEHTIAYISEHETSIASHKGYLFWAEFYPEHNSCPHLSNAYARKVFAEAIRNAKLDETYGISEGTIPRLLHRLTTHSLRHYAITNFSRKNNGNVVLASKFARHTRVETTMTYIHTGKEELYAGIERAQDSQTLGAIRKLQEMAF